MLEKEGLIKDIRKALANLSTYLQMGGKLNLTDSHVQSESFVQDLLNAVYGWQLVSTNQATANYPCIDLIDKNQKLGLQVSSDNSSAKINDTLACLEGHGLAGTITALKAFVLRKKQRQYTIKTPCPGISFEWESDVLDFEDVLKAVNNLPGAQIRTVHSCIVEAMPDIFPDYRAAHPARQSDFRIRDHHNQVHSIDSESCRWSGPARKPAWIGSDPDRMSAPWIVTKFAEGAELHLYFAPGWGDQGTWLVVDRTTKDGVVLNCDQLRELRQVSATTTTTTAPPTAAASPPLTGIAARIGEERDGQGAASALLQHYRDLYITAGPEKEDTAFQHALQRGEDHAKATLKGKIILCTALVEQQLAKATGQAMSPESACDFGLLRAKEWARELRTFRTDIDKQVAGTEKMAPAYDRLEHVHKAVKELMDSLMIHADWSDSAEKVAPGTRERLEALLSRVATLSENTVQTRPPRFITEDELKEAKWAAAECTNIAIEVEKGAGRI